MIDELDVLKIVAERLESAGIPYMITGSIAANFYTTPRMTRDIDIDSIKNAIYNRQIFNIIHNEGIVKVDFIIRKETKYRKIEFQRRRNIMFEGLKIYITSPEDLILSKLFWAKDNFSEMQIQDVKNLMRMVSGLDIDYIEKWVTELGLEKIYKEIKR